MINGKRYPVKFGGLERDTYRHSPGCLAEVAGNCCQCGAMDRATKVYIAKVTP